MDLEVNRAVQGAVMSRRFETTDLAAWIEARFDPASGPGGQNVNKVSTRATLLFDFRACPLLTTAERERVAQRCATRLARDGRLRVVSQQDRSQAANRALAEARLLELLESAVHVPKARHATRPTLGSRRRRLEAKKRRGEVKQRRAGRSGGGE
jgi:ribosome-associated protein